LFCRGKEKRKAEGKRREQGFAPSLILVSSGRKKKKGEKQAPLFPLQLQPKFGGGGRKNYGGEDKLVFRSFRFVGAREGKKGEKEQGGREGGEENSVTALNEIGGREGRGGGRKGENRRKKAIPTSFAQNFPRNESAGGGEGRKNYSSEKRRRKKKREQPSAPILIPPGDLTRWATCITTSRGGGKRKEKKKEG